MLKNAGHTASNDLDYLRIRRLHGGQQGCSPPLQPSEIPLQAAHKHTQAKPVWVGFTNKVSLTFNELTITIKQTDINHGRQAFDVVFACVRVTPLNSFNGLCVRRRNDKAYPRNAFSLPKAVLHLPGFIPGAGNQSALISPVYWCLHMVTTNSQITVGQASGSEIFILNVPWDEPKTVLMMPAAVLRHKVCVLPCQCSSRTAPPQESCHTEPCVRAEGELWCKALSAHAACAHSSEPPSPLPTQTHKHIQNIFIQI